MKWYYVKSCQNKTAEDKMEVQWKEVVLELVRAM